jgi:hypothetical protein
MATEAAPAAAEKNAGWARTAAEAKPAPVVGSGEPPMPTPAEPEEEKA